MSKQVLILGATGRTGLLIVEHALSRGLTVSVLARRPEALGALLSRVSVVQGDVLDSAAVSRAVAGKDAVLCALGPGRDSPPTLCSEGIRNLVSAMQAQRVQRLVCITGVLIGHPQKRLGWLYRRMRSALGNATQDRQLQEQLIRDSGLDWTLVRPPRLTEGRAHGLWRAGEDIFIGALARISRADLAHFMVQQLEDAHFLRRAVTIAY
ncbi:NAD(P)-dependent oxidoreductase [Hyalangium versicolor]|uniref:NAD(P)-dependent oxidoreductase n=1 Tax=Hyalangium versicolor TaxID=2861190 RepID=UPI001CCC397B|nr:SDR family oxidoreductase [Hyalangium versicolor]